MPQRNPGSRSVLAAVNSAAKRPFSLGELGLALEFLDRLASTLSRPETSRKPPAYRRSEPGVRKTEPSVQKSPLRRQKARGRQKPSQRSEFGTVVAKSSPIYPRSCPSRKTGTARLQKATDRSRARDLPSRFSARRSKFQRTDQIRPARRKLSPVVAKFPSRCENSPARVRIRADAGKPSSSHAKFTSRVSFLASRDVKKAWLEGICSHTRENRAIASKISTRSEKRRAAVKKRASGPKSAPSSRNRRQRTEKVVDLKKSVSGDSKKQPSVPGPASSRPDLAPRDQNRCGRTKIAAPAPNYYSESGKFRRGTKFLHCASELKPKSENRRGSIPNSRHETPFRRRAT